MGRNARPTEATGGRIFRKDAVAGRGKNKTQILLG